MITKDRIDEAKDIFAGQQVVHVSALQLRMHISFWDALELIDELKRQRFCEPRIDPQTGIEKLFIVEGNDAEDCKEDGT